MTCDELQAVAADIALDEITGADRAAALTHLGGCSACRTVVAELAAVADSLLLLAPSIEPPEGFESRVVARFGTARSPRRRWARVAAVAAAAAIIGGTVGYVARGDDPRTLPVAALLTSADGHAAGSVVLATGPDRMTCVFEDPRFGGAYDVQVVLADGSIADVGGFSAKGTPWSWTVPLPVDAADVRAVRVLGAGGELRASAEVAG